jgi:3-(methylthio)propanoyl-CoA dehydrogenase
MGRKMSLRQGACLNAFKEEIADFFDAHREHPKLGGHVQALENLTERLFEVAAVMRQRMDSDPLQWASYTYPALMAFGDVILCWRLLDMAIIAADNLQKKASDFYQGKVYQATFYVDITLPRTRSAIETCLRSGREIVEMPEQAF